MADPNPSILSWGKLYPEFWVQKPGPRPEYGEPHYGCFVRDPDGHKIEAAFWDLQLVHKLCLDKAQP